LFSTKRSPVSKFARAKLCFALIISSSAVRLIRLDTLTSTRPQIRVRWGPAYVYTHGRVLYDIRLWLRPTDSRSLNGVLGVRFGISSPKLLGRNIRTAY